METFNYESMTERLYERAKLLDSPVQLQDDGHLRWRIALWDVSFYPLGFDENSNFGVLEKTLDDPDVLLDKVYVFSHESLLKCIHLMHSSQRNDIQRDTDILRRYMPLLRQYPSHSLPNAEDAVDFVSTLEWYIY